MNLDVTTIQKQLESTTKHNDTVIHELESKNSDILRQNIDLKEQLDDLNAFIQERNQEIHDFSMSMTTKTTAISKLKKEAEKCRKERDEANKRTKEVLKESQQAGVLEKQVQEMAKVVDKFSKDADYEKKKNSKLVKENQSLKKEIEKIQKQFSGDNHPASLKSRLGDAQNKLSVVKTNLETKTKEYKEIEEILDARNREIKDILQFSCAHLTSIMTWIDNSFLPSLNSAHDVEDDRKWEVPRVYESVPEILKVKKSSKSKYNLLGYLESLKEILHDTRAEIAEKFKKERKKNFKMKNEMNETLNVKDDIVHDFDNVKEDIAKLENELGAKREEIVTLKSQLIDFKDQVKRKDATLMEVRQDNSRFIWGVVYSLFAVKQNFENYQVIKESVDGLETPMMQSLKKEINDPERCKGLTFDEKKDVAMHLIHIVSEITTSLHSENKRIADSTAESRELRHQFEKQKLENDLNLTQILTEKESNLKVLEKEYEQKYNDFIDSSKQEYSQKQSVAESRIRELESHLQEIEGHNQVLGQDNYDINFKLTKMIAKHDLVKRILISVLFRAEELIFQKNLLKKEYSFLSGQLHFCNDEIIKLKQKADNMNDRMHLKSLKDSMMSQNQNLKDMSMSLNDIEKDHLDQADKVTGYSRIMKFRKSVIAIIAINRLKKYRTGYYGKSLTSFKCFKDINFSSDSHYNEISKKIRLISVPEAEVQKMKEISMIHNRNHESSSVSPKNYNKLDTISNFDVTMNHNCYPKQSILEFSNFDDQSVQNKLCTEEEFDTLRTLSSKKNYITKSDETEPEEDVTESNLIALVDSIIANQNQINKARYQVSTRVKHSSLQISSIYDSLPQLLLSGLRPIRNFMSELPESLKSEYISNCSNYLTPLPYETQYLFFVFLPTSYMAKDVHLLQKLMVNTQRKISELQHESNYRQTELDRTSDRCLSLERDIESLSSKYEQLEQSSSQQISQQQLVHSGRIINLIYRAIEGKP